MRDEKEGRKKQAKSNKQTGKSNKVVTFPKKNELPPVGLEPTTLYTLDKRSTTELPRQLSWLGPNLTSHTCSTPDEQANHQLSIHVHVHNVHVRALYTYCIYMYMYMYLYICHVVLMYCVSTCTCTCMYFQSRKSLLVLQFKLQKMLKRCVYGT